MSEWVEYSLGELTDWFSGGTPSKANPKFWCGNIPWISAKTMTNYKVSKSDLNISEDALEDGSRLAVRNDILLLVRGSGLFHDIPICLVEKDVAFNQDIKAIRAKDPDLQKYIYFWLYSNKKGLNDILDETGIGAGKFDTPLLQEMRISFPRERSHRNQLVLIAESIFEKIDFLHRHQRTLEAMANVLFRQWFVEDVKADWKEKPLSGIADFLNGLACQKFPPQSDSGRLPVLKIRELSGGISESSDWVSSAVKPQYIVEAGDVIFSWSASLMVKVWDGERCVLNQHLFKVTSEIYPKWFYLMWCKHHLADFIAISASHATTMGHIKRGDLDAAMVLVPSPNELDEMSKIMAPILKKQIENARQVKCLEKLRDTLLPKLMSGEVRVAYER